MTPFINQALADRTLGLALHYPLLHAAVLGLGATRTLEFGAGGSTRVIVEALPEGSKHISISTETGSEILYRLLPGFPTGHGKTVWWNHHCGKSEEHRDIDPGPLDLILHDGSHAADVVAADIAWAWPRLKRYGLLLVHDTQHSDCGAEVREGLRRGLAVARVRHTATTLPYGFGLTIVRREEGGPGEVTPVASSPHGTEPKEFFLEFFL